MELARNLLDLPRQMSSLFLCPSWPPMLLVLTVGSESVLPRSWTLTARREVDGDCDYNTIQDTLSMCQALFEALFINYITETSQYPMQRLN